MNYGTRGLASVEWRDGRWVIDMRGASVDGPTLEAAMTNLARLFRGRAKRWRKTWIDDEDHLDGHLIGMVETLDHLQLHAWILAICHPCSLTEIGRIHTRQRTLSLRTGMLEIVNPSSGVDASVVPLSEGFALATGGMRDAVAPVERNIARLIPLLGSAERSDDDVLWQIADWASGREPKGRTASTSAIDAIELRTYETAKNAEPEMLCESGEEPFHLAPSSELSS